MPRCSHRWLYLLPGTALTHEGVLASILKRLNDYVVCQHCDRLGFTLHRRPGASAKQIRLVSNQQIAASIRARAAKILQAHGKESAHA